MCIHFMRGMLSRRCSFDKLAEKLNICKQEDWYDLNTQTLRKHGAGVLLTYFDSLVDGLKNSYPEYEWIPWQFEHVPHGFWNEVENHKRYFDWLAEELGIESQQDWYLCTNTQIGKCSGHAVLLQYRNCLPTALENLYPAFEWRRWLFTQVAADYWTHTNKRKYFDWAAEELGISRQEEWYRVKPRDGYRLKGVDGILKQHNNSFLKALVNTYNEYEWQIWRFSHVSYKFWKKPSNHRKFLDWAAEQLSVHHWKDWYAVKKADIESLGGAQLLSYYGDSIPKTLQRVYAEYPWKPWLFETGRRYIWNDDANSELFFQWLKEHYQIQQVEDWKYVSKEQVVQLGGLGFLLKNGGWLKTLSKYHPSYSWTIYSYKKAQQSLLSIVRSLVSENQLRTKSQHALVTTH